MAADILCYQTTHVPVGSDQKQHIELAHDIATRFNIEHAKEEFFSSSRTCFMSSGTRVMSLRDGNNKMSKSDPSDYSRINLTDTDEMIIKKFKKAKTDAGDMPQSTDDFEDRPDIKNLYNLYSALTNKPLDDIIQHFSDKNFSALKTELADITVEVVKPFRLEIEKTLAETDYIDTILKEGALKARHIAEPILRKTYDIMGFYNLMAEEKKELFYVLWMAVLK